MVAETWINNYFNATLSLVQRKVIKLVSMREKIMHLKYPLAAVPA